MKKMPLKTQNRFIVDILLLGLDHIVWGKWFTAQMWALYINKNCLISYAPLVDATMLHHSVSSNNEIKISYL